MVGVQDVLDQSARILLQRVKPAWCTKFLLQVLCKSELFSGVGGSFIQKKKEFQIQKRESLDFLWKKESCPNVKFGFTFSKSNLECKGQWQHMQGERIIFWAEQQAAEGGLPLLKK